MPLSATWLTNRRKLPFSFCRLRNIDSLCLSTKESDHFANSKEDLSPIENKEAKITPTTTADMVSIWCFYFHSPFRMEVNV